MNGNGGSSGPRSGGAAQRAATVTAHKSADSSGGTGRTVTSATPAAQKRQVTGHWIGDKPVLPHQDMTGAQRNYLMNTNMNIQHSSMEQFNKRADAFAQALPKERQVLAENREAMKDNTSSLYQQSSHMVHTQRGDFWARRAPQRSLAPDSAAGQSYQQKVMGDLQRAKVDRRQAMPDDKHYDNLMDLMVGGKQGPLTREQTEMGIQAAVVGHKVLGRDRHEETGGDYSATKRGQTGRVGHPTSSATGVDLSGDADSVARDAASKTVFMGTSGSTSDIVRSHHAAVQSVNKNLGANATFGVRGASDATANDATTRLATTWMRESVPAKMVAQHIDKQLNTGDQQRISKGPVDSTQTHSMSEIQDAVTKTRNAIRARQNPPVPAKK